MTTMNYNTFQFVAYNIFANLPSGIRQRDPDNHDGNVGIGNDGSTLNGAAHSISNTLDTPRGSCGVK